jgi:hypothetical protein
VFVGESIVSNHNLQETTAHQISPNKIRTNFNNHQHPTHNKRRNYPFYRSTTNPKKNPSRHLKGNEQNEGKFPIPIIELNIIFLKKAVKVVE